MPYSKFDRSRLVFSKLNQRKNRVFIERDHVTVSQAPEKLSSSDIQLIRKTAERIRAAKKNKSSVILAFGAHAIKNGLSTVIISLMEKGWITHLATNGAGIIHDWEFAYQGKSSEDVRENVEKGMFGLWEETGFYLNLALNVGSFNDLGYGESVGSMISNEGLEIPEISELQNIAILNLRSNPDLSAAAASLAGIIDRFDIRPGFMKIPHPYRKYSVQWSAYESGIPFTGHPMIGHDIIYCHQMCSGLAIGKTAMNDFLCFAESIGNLNGGVYISLGSAVMSPMIFEKSLSMARNIRIQGNETLNDHFIVVVDLAKSDWDWQKEGEPPADNPAYYLRFCKTFNRMGGEMHYLNNDNLDFLLELNRCLSN
jgi:hypothetical protein